MRTISRLFAGAALLAALAWPSRAQHLGDVSPSEVANTLATATACTGGLQNFQTGSTFNGVIFNNLGQTIHTAIVTPAAGITQLSVQIFGVDNAGNAMAITEQAFSPTGTAAIATGSGFFPNLRIVVQCNTGGTFNLTYSGTSSAPFINAGTSLQNQLTKVLGQTMSSGSSVTLSTFTPFGNSSGVLWYTTVGAAGGAPTLAVSCAGGTPTQSFSATFSPASSALQIQTFPLPASPCWSLTVLYTPNGAAGASNLSIGVSFNAPGLNVFSGDPCASANSVKLSAVVTAPAAATTQIIAPPPVGQQINVCAYHLGEVTAVAGTYQWITGTGATCGTATVNKTGAVPVNTALPFTVGYGGTVFSAAPGSGVCIVLTGAGDNAAGIVTYVLQ